MGRITVFAIESCRHCKRAKAALNARDIPYSEINLTLYPNKRSDMLSLTDRLTVPQIFFNEKHIGGAEETVTVLESWDKETEMYTSPRKRYEEEIEAQVDPSDPRLMIPTEAPKSKAAAPPRSPDQMEDEFVLPLSENASSSPEQPSTSYAKLYHTFLQILPRESKQYLGKSYKNCFKGSQAVDAIQQHYNVKDRTEVVDFLRKVQKSKMLDHVTHEHEFGDNSYFYRLQHYFNPKVLNNIRIWTDRVDPDAIELVIRLKKELEKVESKATDNDGNVNYLEAKKDLNYSIFQEASCELQKVDMFAMNESTRLAFCINLYNLMIKHAFIELGIPTTNYQRAGFFPTVGYNIGGHTFSFNDIENGIIRGNRKAPYSLLKPFSSSDPRFPLALSKPDCRIHFALNCGAKSCPPIKTFSAEAIDEELRIVSQSFHESDSNTFVDESNHELSLSMILNWYRTDFASAKSNLPQSVLPFLRGEKQQQLQRMIDDPKVQVKVKFFTYDWSTNASQMMEFHSDSLNVTKISPLGIFKNSN